MRIRIEGHHLPGRSCGPSPDHPEGYPNIHVAVQGRKGVQDLLGLTPGDAPSACWDLAVTVVRPPPDADLRGPQTMGPPGARFIYLSWGVVDGTAYRMFRRAKLWLDGVPPAVLGAAVEGGLLVGRLSLADAKGMPVCAAVRPPRITWSAGDPAEAAGAD